MSAPERVWVRERPDNFGGMVVRVDDSEEFGGIPYVSESRALAAEQERDAAQDKALRFDLDRAGIEQRDREAVEIVSLRADLAALRAERDYLTLCLGEANASKEAAHGEVARIRAERDALVPLARFGLWAHEESQSAGGLWEDEAKAKSFELGLHIGFGRDSDVTTAARAILEGE